MATIALPQSNGVFCAVHAERLLAWQVSSELVRYPLMFSSCELLLWEAASWGRGQFGNPEEGERWSLEAATKQRLMKTVTDWEDLVCPILICAV
jgi:hypothetical protein